MAAVRSAWATRRDMCWLMLFDERGLGSVQELFAVLVRFLRFAVQGSDHQEY